MRSWPLVACLLLANLGLDARARAEAPPAAAAAAIELRGFDVPFALAAGALAALPRHEVLLDDHGRSARFSGVALQDVLKRAGAPLGALRGKGLALVLLAHGADGYVAVFALSELDDDFGATRVLLVDRRDDAALGAAEGPFRLVVPDDERAARAVRQRVRLELRSLR